MQDKTSFEILPTGKQHVSFSEVKTWKECSYRHNLAHVKKIGIQKPSPVLDFGTAVHAAHENFIKTGIMNAQIATDMLINAWKLNSYEESLEKSLASANQILSEVSDFYSKTFPGWEPIAAEHFLYEKIQSHQIAFKGYVDAIIKTKDKHGKVVVWILDVKTSQSGWRRDKRSDVMIQSQLGLYKNYWQQKNPEVALKDIRCGFILLKKSGKIGERCELFSVSLGEVPIKRALKVVSNMITSVKKGIALKNRDSCTWCEFKDTEHCT